MGRKLPFGADLKLSLASPALRSRASAPACASACVRVCGLRAKALISKAGQVREAMQAEHCSEDTFVSANYGFNTCPRNEWEFVTDPKKDKTYPGESRLGM